MGERFLPDKLSDSKGTLIQCPGCKVYPGQLHKDNCPAKKEKEEEK